MYDHGKSDRCIVPIDAIDHECLVKLLRHRISDQRVERLVRKWLNAGVLEHGEHKELETGTPQGGVISPLLANIYLHYVFDLWAHEWRRKHGKGEMIIVRYADDFIVGCETQRDGEDFLEELRARFKRYGLALHPDKTRLLEFGRYAIDRHKERGEGKPETFDFLGFTHYCSKNRDGWFAVKRRTRRKKLNAKLKEVKYELRKRMHKPIPVVAQWLKLVLIGHYRYYGVPGNLPKLRSFRGAVVRLWWKTLCHRSQKGYVTWERMRRLKLRWLPKPKIYHPYPRQRLVVTTRGRSPVR